jgi:hypothetical protein
MTVGDPVSLLSLARRPWSAVLFALLVLALLGVAPQPADASDANRRAEKEFIALANIERAKVGLGALTERSEIRTVARTWSATMASTTQLAHNPNYSTQITGWQRVSENVGRGPTVAAIHKALMASDGHRRNILDDRVTQVGVGVVIQDGRVWVTQNFRRPQSNVTHAAPTLTTFGDVSSRSAHAGSIGRITAAQVETGCSPARFCPDDTVTRGQLASMLVRALGIPATTERRFTDVSGPYAEDIEALAAADITNGCAVDRFCPDQLLSRAHMASLLARSLSYGPAPSPFVDAPSNHAGAIGALHSRGMIKGCSATRFCPTETVSRAQTASMLAGALG